LSKNRDAPIPVPVQEKGLVRPRYDKNWGDTRNSRKLSTEGRRGKGSKKIRERIVGSVIEGGGVLGLFAVQRRRAKNLKAHQKVLAN